MLRNLPLALFFLLLACSTPRSGLKPGIITASARISPGLYAVDMDTLSQEAFLIIEENNVVIDFNRAVIDARMNGRTPDMYEGICILVRNCKNVTIRNVHIRGFKMGILAENVTHLTIEGADVSYNYRPRLLSKWNRESLSDWLYYHQNEADEWKRYGAGLYLKNCNDAIIRNNRCHQGMNALLMTGCNRNLICNNDFSFNSGLGIGLYRSGHNTIMHNKLDWNARGYSHGQYARGQDSSAILLYEQSSGNVIAYNSGTHSGDGLFLWAGQSTMDTGEGGCDSNVICKNDFSHSIANAIEVTFSANIMIGNKLNDSRYGIWGGYSHHSIMKANEIHQCETGIAIEHGRYNVIDSNEFADTGTGIELWARSSQPEDWPYPKHVDVRSRGYSIRGNAFSNIPTPLKIKLTDSIALSGNINENGLPVVFPEGLMVNPYFPQDHGALKYDYASVPAPLPDGINTALNPNQLRGRRYIIVDEWGPYDFKSPRIVLRRKSQDGSTIKYYLDILGPPGTYHIDSVHGCTMPIVLTGSIPFSVILVCAAESDEKSIDLTYLGQEVISSFGDTIVAGSPYAFGFHENEVTLKWAVSFYVYDSIQDPLKHQGAFRDLLAQPPTTTITAPALNFHWWGKPVDVIRADQFAVVAIASGRLSAQPYLFEVESDDGIRVWMDDKIILEHWDIHTPEVDQVTIHPSEGIHTFRIEYFEGGGLGVLDVSLTPVGTNKSP